MLSYGIWGLVGLMLIIALVGVGFLIWGWRKGQFKDIESAKYQMLEEKEPEPWPGRGEVKNEHS